jgi:hypothetical protein
LHITIANNYDDYTIIRGILDSKVLLLLTTANSKCENAISNEYKLEKTIDSLVREHTIKENDIKVNLYSKEEEIRVLREQDISNSDAIVALSEQVIKLTREIELLKNQQNS